MMIVLTCISTRYSILKEEWANAKKETKHPENIRGRLEKIAEEKDGLVHLIDEKGKIYKTTDIYMPTGILNFQGSLLIASPWSIHKVSQDLSIIESHAYTLPLFNSIHCISRTRSGFLVASTGLDLLLELDEAGKILWSWWATEHGFDLTPLGRQRYINRLADHRGFFYGTAAHTTHINSAVELENGDILASLFHQGKVILIRRANGQWIPILENLNHPHSIRLLKHNYFTVTDTGHGKALLARLRAGEHAYVEVEKEVSIDTEWLQDCFYDWEHNKWFLVDGTHSQVVILNEDSKEVSYLAFDPEWRLYSIEPIYD